MDIMSYYTYCTCFGATRHLGTPDKLVTLAAWPLLLLLSVITLIQLVNLFFFFWIGALTFIMHNSL